MNRSIRKNVRVNVTETKVEIGVLCITHRPCASSKKIFIFFFYLFNPNVPAPLCDVAQLNFFVNFQVLYGGDLPESLYRVKFMGI